jgi:hypothetical protein
VVEAEEVELPCRVGDCHCHSKIPERSYAGLETTGAFAEFYWVGTVALVVDAMFVVVAIVLV